MPVWLIISVTTLYVLGLFLIAWRGDKSAREQTDAGETKPVNGFVYAMALAVYSPHGLTLALLAQLHPLGGTLFGFMLGPLLFFYSFLMSYAGSAISLSAKA